MKRQKSHKFISFFLLSFFHQIEVVGALRMTNWRLKDMRMRRDILHSLEALYLKDSMSLEYESAMPIPYCILFYFFPPNKRPQMKIILLLFFRNNAEAIPKEDNDNCLFEYVCTTRYPMQQKTNYLNKHEGEKNSDRIISQYFYSQVCAWFVISYPDHGCIYLLTIM